VYYPLTQTILIFLGTYSLFVLMSRKAVSQSMCLLQPLSVCRAGNTPRIKLLQSHCHSRLLWPQRPLQDLFRSAQSTSINIIQLIGIGLHVFHVSSTLVCCCRCWYRVMTSSESTTSSTGPKTDPCGTEPSTALHGARRWSRSILRVLDLVRLSRWLHI